MPAPQIHRRQQPLTIPPPTGPELENTLPFLQKQRRVFALTSAKEAEILLEDRILSGEMRSPGESDEFVLAFSGEIVDRKGNQEADAYDLHGVRPEIPRSRFGGGCFIGRRSGDRIGLWIALLLLGSGDGDAFELVFVPEIGGERGCGGRDRIRRFGGIGRGDGDGGRGDRGGDRNEGLGVGVGEVVVEKIIGIEALEVGRSGDGSGDDGEEKEEKEKERRSASHGRR